MNREITLSVIVPIYNGERYLPALLESVTNQTFDDFQLICINDGSTDNTAHILENFKKNDKRIEVYTQTNLGAGAARNLGLQYVRGKYISILDADDILDKHMYEKMIAFAENFNSDIVICRASGFSDAKDNINIDYSLKTELINCEKEVFNISNTGNRGYNFCIGWTWDKIFKSSLIFENGIFFQELRRAEDLFFTFFAISIANKISILDEYLIKHRYHKNSMSATRHEYILDFYEAINHLYERLNEARIYNDLKPSFLYWLSKYSVWQYSSFSERNQKIIRGILRNSVFKKFDLLSPENIFLCDKESIEVIKEIMWDYYIKNNPLVSVVVSGYNVEKYIADSLDSVINQTYAHIEILAIDDGSTDKTTEIMKDYADKDPRIKFFSFNKNSPGGIGTSGNFGIDHATGEYIIFCDGDDWLALTAIEDFLKIILKDNSDFVYSKNARFDDKKKQFSPHYDIKLWESIKQKKELKELKKELFLMGTEPWKKMYSIKFINTNNIRFPVGNFFYEDMPFHIKCIILASKISILNKVTYYYRINRIGSTTNRKDNSQLKVYDHLQMLLDWMKKEKIFYVYKNVFLLKALRSMSFIRDGINIKGLVKFYVLTSKFYRNFSVKEIKQTQAQQLNDYKAIPLALAARGGKLFLFSLFLLSRRGT